MASYSATFLIRNQTDHFFTLVSAGDGGTSSGAANYTFGLSPPKIPKGSPAEPGYSVFRMENDSGVQGWAIFEMDDKKTRLKITYWSCSGDHRHIVEFEGGQTDRFQCNSATSDEKNAIGLFDIVNK